jgi:hypothetical protein
MFTELTVRELIELAARLNRAAAHTTPRVSAADTNRRCEAISLATDVEIHLEHAATRSAR